MSKEELFKKYQEIVLKTNGGADDYVISLCQISNLIKEFAKEKDQQIADLQKQLALTEKALELACETIKQMCGKPLWIGGNIQSPEPKDSEYFKDLAKEMLENE